MKSAILPFAILASIFSAAMAASQAPQLQGVPQKISAGQTMNLTWSGGNTDPVSLALVEGSAKIPIGIIAGNVTGGAFDWTIDSGIANANDYYIQVAQDTVYSYSDQFAISGATTTAATVTPNESQPSPTSSALAAASTSSASSAASSTAAVAAVASSSPSSAASSAVSSPSSSPSAQSLNGTALQATSGGNSTESLVGGHVHLTTGGIVGIVIGIVAILIGISTIGIFALVLKMLKKHGPPGHSSDDVEELSSLGPARSMNHGPGGGPGGGNGAAPTYYPKRTNSADSDSSGVLGRGGLHGNPTRTYDDLGSPETLVPRRVGDEDISLVPSAAGSGRVSPNDRYAAAAAAAHPGQQVQISGTGNASEHGSRSPTSTYENNGGIMAAGFVPGEYRYGGNVGGYESGDTHGSLVPPPLQRPGTADSGRTLAYPDGGRNLMGGSSPPGGSRLRNQV